MDSEIMRAKKGRKRSKKGKRKLTKCVEVRRRMGKSGMRIIRKCPGKPARIVG